MSNAVPLAPGVTAMRTASRSVRASSARESAAVPIDPKLASGNGDLFHTNAIEVLDGRLEEQDPAFRAGNLLVSSRILNAIIVLDPDTERAVWARTGDFRRQHDPHALSNGRILLFDNVGLSKSQSRVLEIDAATGKHGWSYTHADGPKKFFSRTCGLAERLDTISEALGVDIELLED